MGGVLSDPAAQPLCFALSAVRYGIADYPGRDRHVSDLAVGRQTQWSSERAAIGDSHIQRFGSVVKVSIYLDALVLDGVYHTTGRYGLRFQPVDAIPSFSIGRGLKPKAFLWLASIVI